MESDLSMEQKNNAEQGKKTLVGLHGESNGNAEQERQPDFHAW